MLDNSELLTKEQFSHYLQMRLLLSIREFAPDAWNELIRLAPEYKIAFGLGFANWEAYSFILIPSSTGGFHWEDFPHVFDDLKTLREYQAMYAVCTGLKNWIIKYEIPETTLWVLDQLLKIIRMLLQFPDLSDASNSELEGFLGMEFFYMPIDPAPPKLHSYNPDTETRKEYLKSASEILKKYCEESEERAKKAEMTKPETHHSKAIEWLIRYQFCKESYTDIGKNKDESVIRKAIRKLETDIDFPVRTEKLGRPKSKK